MLLMFGSVSIKRLELPKLRDDVPARNQLFSATNHENQRFHGLLLELHSSSVAAKFVAPEVEFDRSVPPFSSLHGAVSGVIPCGSVVYNDIRKDIYPGLIERVRWLSKYSDRSMFKRSMFNCGGRIMKRNLYLIMLALVELLSGSGQFFKMGAQTRSAEKNAFTPNTILYGPAPAFVPPGAQLAVIEGIPAAPGGDYTVRLKMPEPDGYRIAPHWHPQRENVTVILGTFKLGMGEITLTKARWQISQPAVFAYLDPDMQTHPVIGNRRATLFLPWCSRTLIRSNHQIALAQRPNRSRM
jgi:hypothetical protein